MGISRKAQQQIAEGGWIRKMFEEGIVLKQKYGENNVFDLSLGNPIVEPPEKFKRELAKWATHPEPGMHRYMPNAGYPETRAAIARDLAAKTGLPFTANEIAMSCGAAGALNVVLKTILDAGDEVVLFSPYFAEYIYYVDTHQGVPRMAPTDSRFLPDIAALEKCIGPKTRAVLINSPNNPTGAVYRGETLEAIGKLLEAKSKEYGREIFLLSDEVYQALVYGGEAPSACRYYDASIVTTSFSKSLALPGERIGYIAVSPRYAGRVEMMGGFVFYTRVLGFVNAPALMQHLLPQLLDTSVDVADYLRKRDFFCDSLTAMGYEMVKPEGAFYIFPKSPIEDEVAFVRELQSHNVLVVPGRGFGAPGYFRIAYCVDDRVIEGSLAGFRAAAKKYGYK